MTVKDRPTTIPAPTGSAGIPMSASHYAHSVHVDGHTVIFERKDTESFGVCIRVVDGSTIYPHLLLESTGRKAIAMGLHCGGRLDSTYVWLGEPADQALALQAIPHIHEGCAAHRRTLTAMYRHLLKHRDENGGE